MVTWHKTQVDMKTGGLSSVKLYFREETLDAVVQQAAEQTIRKAYRAVDQGITYMGNSAHLPVLRDIGHALTGLNRVLLDRAFFDAIVEKLQLIKNGMQVSVKLKTDLSTPERLQKLGMVKKDAAGGATAPIAGYAQAGGYGAGRKGRMHIRRDILTQGGAYPYIVFIHEASHWYASTADYGYKGDDNIVKTTGGKELKAEEHKNNADTVAWLTYESSVLLNPPPPAVIQLEQEHAIGQLA